MLALTLRPGEYVDIGDNVRFVFTGGSENNIHVLVDAPKDLVIFRSAAPPEVMKPRKARKVKKAKKTRKANKTGNAEMTGKDKEVVRIEMAAKADVAENVVEIEKTIEAVEVAKDGNPARPNGKNPQTSHRGGRAEESLETRIRRIFERY